MSVGLEGGDEPRADPYRVGAGVECGADVGGGADPPGRHHGDVTNRLPDGGHEVGEGHRAPHVAAGLDTLGHDVVATAVDCGPGLVHRADLPSRHHAVGHHRGLGPAPEELDHRQPPGDLLDQRRIQEPDDEAGPDRAGRAGQHLIDVAVHGVGGLTADGQHSEATRVGHGGG
jgi:hypothetical protein